MDSNSSMDQVAAKARKARWIFGLCMTAAVGAALASSVGGNRSRPNGGSRHAGSVSHEVNFHEQRDQLPVDAINPPEPNAEIPQAGSLYTPGPQGEPVLRSSFGPEDYPALTPDKFDVDKLVQFGGPSSRLSVRPANWGATGGYDATADNLKTIDLLLSALGIPYSAEVGRPPRELAFIAINGVAPEVPLEKLPLSLFIAREREIEALSVLLAGVTAGVIEPEESPIRAIGFGPLPKPVRLFDPDESTSPK